MTLAEDTVLEKRFRIDGLLARGGMGAIYRAFDLHLKIPVAIKENALSTPARVAQFKQEALILARLRHPALPRVIHHFSVEGKQYLVMDFIEGENLWELVQRQQKPLPEDKALDYIIQVCRAVSYLHQQHPPIIHRDIKPQNIKITPDGQAVLVDFGIAKQVVSENAATLAGAKGITPGFSPPEQYLQRGTTPASDLYSLGATLYAVLTGQKPPDSISLVASHGKFQPPDQLNKKVSPGLAQAVVHAMQIEPADRPPSVAAWQEELVAAPHADAAGADDRQATLALPKPPPAQLSPAVSPALAEALYWLVDARGQGYPLPAGDLTIGRHSEVDVQVEDLSVSRNHARLRVEAGRCLISDNGSANGTFVNDRRLGADWCSLNPGDLLAVGSVRFYLTTTKPARLASQPLQPATVGHPGEVTTRTPSPAPAPPPAPASRSGRRALWLSLSLLLAVLIIGAAVYWLLNPALLVQFSGSTPPVAGGTQAAQTVTPAAAAGQVVTPAIPTEQPTQAGPTPTLASLAATITPTSPGAAPSPTMAASPGPTAPAQKSDTLGQAATPTGLALTQTATLTVSVTVTATRNVAAAAGPTVIPLEFTESTPELGSREVIDVDFNPKNPAEVYALVKGDGIYRSSTGGDGPWAKLPVDGASLVALVIDPADPTRLYGPTWNAVLKSTDGGNTWEAKMNGLVANRTVDVLVIDPQNPHILYGGVGETMVVSTDGGESWQSQEYGAGLGVARLHQIVVDPFNPATIYVAGLGAAVYKSVDSGRSFLPMPFNTGEGAYGLAAHPAQKDALLAGVNSSQAAIIRTQNGWDFEPASTGLIYGGADSAYSALAYAPSNPAIVYAGSGYESNPKAKGVFKSTDGGASWFDVSNGLRRNPDTGFPYYIKAIVVHPANPASVFLATGSGLYRSVDGGQSWQLR